MSFKIAHGFLGSPPRPPPPRPAPPIATVSNCFSSQIKSFVMFGHGSKCSFSTLLLDAPAPDNCQKSHWKTQILPFWLPGNFISPFLNSYSVRLLYRSKSRSSQQSSLSINLLYWRQWIKTRLRIPLLCTVHSEKQYQYSAELSLTMQQ